MSETSIAPDISALEIPIDQWTQPFWDATAQGRIVMPRCVACGTYRWPPGPFCPQCSTQQVSWSDAGPGRVYSYTLIPGRAGAAGQQRGPTVPALIEFPESGGMRLLAALVDTAIPDIAVGAPVCAGFSQAVNGKVPVFRIIARQQDLGGGV
jgi:uncharacterized protein